MSEASPRLRSAPAGSLVELVEPLFLYVCRLNRIARSQGQIASHTSAPFASHSSSYEQTRAEIGRIFTAMKDDSVGDVMLGKQYDQIEMPLVFFADSIIAESQLPYRDRWNENRLAAERGELAGDDKFFDMLDECLADATEEATERLVVYFTCLGLGFTGKFSGDQLQIDTRMQRITHRIRRRWLNRDFEKRLAPQTYEHTDRSDLPKPSRDSLIKIITAWSCTIVALFILYLTLYKSSSDELGKLVEQLAGSAAATPKSQ